ncbi:hypothetical protein ACTRXD_00035 [Nitrospira sp. T9]|uniref:hypothetical protein n=1 Tax=unclassified Nitrospira TaxID=2652172 RepID=UPI003F9B2291
MAKVSTPQVNGQDSSSLISLTTMELTRVCAIAKNHSFLYPVPLSKIVDRVLDYSIRTVEAWELIDIDFWKGDEIDFERWFEWCDDLTLSISFKNHEHDTTETLEVDIIQVMGDVLKEKSRSLYVGGLEIELGEDHLMVEGKNHSLKNGMVRIAVTTEKPSY